MYITCDVGDDEKECISYFTRNTFEYNEANWGGGGVYWLGVEPHNLTTNNTFVGNDAVYGANFASNATSIIQITADTYNNELNPDNATTRLLTTNTLTSIASGQTVSTDSILYLAIVDKYN